LNHKTLLTLSVTIIQKEQHVKHSFNTTPPSISQPNLGKT